MAGPCSARISNNNLLDNDVVDASADDGYDAVALGGDNDVDPDDAAVGRCVVVLRDFVVVYHARTSDPKRFSRPWSGVCVLCLLPMNGHGVSGFDI